MIHPLHETVTPSHHPLLDSSPPVELAQPSRKAAARLLHVRVCVGLNVKSLISLK